MSTQLRIRVKETAPTGIPITANDSDEILGEFVPGLGYWVTPQNSGAIAALIAAGHADYDDPANAPKLPAELGAAEGKISGFLSVGE